MPQSGIGSLALVSWQRASCCGAELASRCALTPVLPEQDRPLAGGAEQARRNCYSMSAIGAEQLTLVASRPRQRPEPNLDNPSTSSERGRGPAHFFEVADRES